jgi:lysophospholipase L1-like esterase
MSKVLERHRDQQLFKAMHNRQASTAAFDPLTSSGLVIYLDASDASTFTLTGTRVDQWRDKSGNGNHFGTSSAGVTYNPTRSSTAFGNRGGVIFDPRTVHNMLDGPATISNLKHNSYTAIIGYIKRRYFTVGLLFDKTNNITLHGCGQYSRLGNVHGPGQNAEGVSNGVAVVHAVTNSSGTYKSCLGQNTLQPTFANLNGALAPTTGSVDTGGCAVLELGGNFPSHAQSAMFYGDVAFVLVWTRVLTQAEINAVATWANTNWGISIAAPTRNIVFDGNSIVQGKSAVETPFQAVAMGTLGLTLDNYLNYGLSGQTTPQMTTAGTTRIDPLYNSSLAAKYNVVVAWELTNDIVSGTAEATVKTNIQAYCQARKNAGWKVVVGTCLPRTISGGIGQATFNSIRDSVNTWINANAVSGGWADAVADVASDATIGETGDNANATYYSDGVHLTDAGHNLAAPYFSTALSAVMA